MVTLIQGSQHRTMEG